jgi:hypothetical protein
MCIIVAALIPLARRSGKLPCVGDVKRWRGEGCSGWLSGGRGTSKANVSQVTFAQLATVVTGVLSFYTSSWWRENAATQFGCANANAATTFGHANANVATTNNEIL